MTKQPSNPQENEYQEMTLLMMVQLSAPHTWPAAIIPALIGTCLAAAFGFHVSATLAMVLLAIVILMQSAVNTINDYYDYKKGTDTQDNQADPTDAVLVYNHINPKSVKYFALCLLACAFILGMYVIYCSDFIPLFIALFGALIVFLYSGGKTPISYLPIGEFVSGFVMGCLISFACYYSLTLDLNFFIFLYSIPVFLGIGLILMTNNTCDIEKDIPAQRKTLAVLLGREKSLQLYHALLILMIVSLFIIVAVSFKSALLLCVFALFALIPFIQALWNNKLVAQTRAAAMSQILTINVVVGAFYASFILFGTFVAIAL